MAAQTHNASASLCGLGFLLLIIQANGKVLNNF
jgi:hypothetical protein